MINFHRFTEDGQNEMKGTLIKIRYNKIIFFFFSTVKIYLSVYGLVVFMLIILGVNDKFSFTEDSYNGMKLIKVKIQ